MKILALIFTILTMSSFTTDELILEDIRQNYQLAVSDKNICQSMIKQLSDQTLSPVQLAYYGAFQTIWANHVLNPIDKLRTFKKGKKNIDNAIKLSPRNTEIIFIRHSIQKHTPAFLDYKKNMKADEIFLRKEVNNIKSSSLKNLVVQLLKN